MLYLVTGANGAGKTLNTLKWVRERSVKEGRPVCHNGRFEPIEGGELSTWKKIDFKDWQAEPDGTIFLIDECHNDLPLSPPSAKPLEHIRMLAEHRRRGFDFYLVTQHPQNIDAFVRRLIGSPGWHRHLKRTFGGDLVSCIEWPAVNPGCEKNNSGRSGNVTMLAFPKEVFTWYKSASLHTGKKKIPKTVWMLLALVVIIPLMLYFAATSLMDNVTGKTKAEAAAAAQVQADPSAAPARATAAARLDTSTVEHYLVQRVPRLPDFPHTAPIYDDTTKPVQAPYPAACVQMRNTCKCYTQQATLMQVSGDVCAQIVRQGFFVDWQRDEKPNREYTSPARLVVANGPSQAPSPRSLPLPDVPEQQQGEITPGQLSSALALRNPSFAGLRMSP